MMTTHTPLNTSALQKNYRLEAKTIAVFFTLFVIYFTIMFIEVGSVIFILLLVIGTLLTGLALYLGARLQQERRRKIETFAAENGLAHIDEETLLSLVPSCLKGLGFGERAYFGHALPIAGRTVILFDYQFTTGTGKSREIHYYSIACLTTKKSYPHLFLDGRVNGISSPYTGSQRISLEGDFNKYFTLYIPDGGHILALSVITPDVMAVLIDTSAQFDVEIEGNNITFITGTPLYAPEGIAQIEQAVLAMVKEFDQKDENWQPEVRIDGSAYALHKGYIFRSNVKLWLGAIGFIFYSAIAITLFYLAS